MGQTVKGLLGEIKRLNPTGVQDKNLSEEDLRILRRLDDCLKDTTLHFKRREITRLEQDIESKKRLKDTLQKEVKQ